MANKKKVALIVTGSLVGFLSVSVLLGLVFTGKYVGWGPFKSLFWEQEVKRIQKSYPYDENQEGIVFYGPSNFRLWTEMTNDLKEYKVVNSGFGGSTDKIMVKYADRLLYPYKPKVLFFQTGSNDYVEMSGTDEEKISTCMEYKKVMYQTFHNELPNTKLVVMSGLLLPGRSAYTDLTIKVNEKLNEYAKTIDYLYFVNANEMTFDGTNYRKELFQSDGIHLNHEGQLEWRDKYIKPEIESLINEFSFLESVRK